MWCIYTVGITHAHVQHAPSHSLLPSHTTHTVCTLSVFSFAVAEINQLLEFVLITKHSLTLSKVQVIVRETDQRPNQSAVASLTEVKLNHSNINTSLSSWRGEIHFGNDKIHVLMQSLTDCFPHPSSVWKRGRIWLIAWHRFTAFQCCQLGFQCFNMIGQPLAAPNFYILHIPNTSVMIIIAGASLSE